MGSHVRFWLFVMLALACLTPLHAQDPAEPSPPDGPIHTLHVYMDLIQLPVLVLDSDQERMKPIDGSYFRASLDSGPEFRPRHVRQEGDDPITLAIVLDPATEPAAMEHMDRAIASLAPLSLHANDHVTIFVMNCSGLTRTLRDVPANASVLQASVERGLKTWTETHKLKHPPACEQRVHLWDALGFAAAEIGSLPGRRVLLAVTSGADGGSKKPWNEVRQFAQVKGVAVFGYSSRHDAPGFSNSNTGVRSSRSAPPTTSVNISSEDPFESLCELTGGMVMHLSADYVPKQLTKFTTMVRERYILEFSRPRNDQPGDHNISVSIPKKNPRAYVRPSGVTIMTSNASEDADTIPRDQTDAPEIGTRRPIKPK